MKSRESALKKEGRYTGRQAGGGGEGGRQAEERRKERAKSEGRQVPPVVFLLYHDCWH